MEKILYIIFITIFVGSIISALVSLVRPYWYIILALVVVGLVIHCIRKVVEEKEARKEAEAKRKKAEAEREDEEKAEWQRYRERQQEYRRSMVLCGEQSMSVFESMPNHLDSAEQWLDQAEADFMEGAFAPFWDSIENAATCLALFDESVRQITDQLSQYTELVKKYKAEPPRFPLSPESVTKLTVSTAIADRMRAIVRTAQRNFQFSVIYEQRKTNQLLVAGFTNLAQALEQMTWQITASLDDLASSVDAMGFTLNESMRAIHSRMGEIADTTAKHRENFLREASESAAREKKVVEMLDNIQRRRKPL